MSQPTVEIGRSVELRWVTAGSVSAAIDNGIGAVPLAGTLRVSPKAATTYVLTATDAMNATATAMVTVTVLARADRSLLPPNATELERGLEGASRQPVDLPIRKLWSSADCPVDLLPYLAWALGVEEWDSDWPEPVKRTAVANAFAIHREKGTLAGLKRLLMDAGAEYEYTERPAGVAMTALVEYFQFERGLPAGHHLGRRARQARLARSGHRAGGRSGGAAADPRRPGRGDLRRDLGLGAVCLRGEFRVSSFEFQVEKLKTKN